MSSRKLMTLFKMTTSDTINKTLSDVSWKSVLIFKATLTLLCILCTLFTCSFVQITSDDGIISEMHDALKFLDTYECYWCLDY